MKYPIVIDGFNCTTDTGKTSSITLLEGQFLDIVRMGGVVVDIT